jgi:hypothetical protein
MCKIDYVFLTLSIAIFAPTQAEDFQFRGNFIILSGLLDQDGMSLGAIGLNAHEFVFRKRFENFFAKLIFADSEMIPYRMTVERKGRHNETSVCHLLPQTDFWPL